jgi:hypothetical protein
VVVVVLLRGVRFVAEFRVRPVRRRMHGHEVRLGRVLVGRRVVLVLVPVLVRMLVGMHVRVLPGVVVRVCHGRSSSQCMTAGPVG